PFIRYRTGDAGALATRPCRCGSSQPALAEVQGRILDWFVDDQGRRLAPQHLWLSVHLPDGLSVFRRYQVRQERSGKVTLLLVPREQCGQDLLHRLEHSYRRALGPGTPIEARLVERLDNEPSGKFRTIIADHVEVHPNRGEPVPSHR